MHTLDNSTRVALGRALQVLEVLRTLDPDMTMGTAVSFLMVSLEETDEGGLSVTELSRRGGFALSSASRYIQALGELDRRREPGLQLVSDQVDIMERRKKILRVTAKGRRVIDQLKRAIGG